MAQIGDLSAILLKASPGAVLQPLRELIYFGWGVIQAIDAGTTTAGEGGAPVQRHAEGTDQVGLRGPGSLRHGPAGAAGLRHDRR